MQAPRTLQLPNHGRPRLRPLSAAELDRVWSVPLTAAEDAALAGAFARDTQLRGELGPLLVNLDEELRESFVSSLARALGGPRPPVDIAAAVAAALDRTRIAAFWYGLGDAGGAA